MNTNIDLEKINSYYDSGYAFLVFPVLAVFILIVMPPHLFLRVLLIGALCAVSLLHLFTIRASAPKNPIGEDEFNTYISSLHLESLKTLATSPEVKDDPKSLIVKFLNKEKPGWSLEASDK